MKSIFPVWALWLLAALLAPVSVAAAAELRLAIANSTCDAMKQVGDLYQAANPVRFSFICKSSGLIAKGLRGGALSADLFISADKEWMDFLVDKDLVERKQVSSPWGNALVLATQKASTLELRELDDLALDKVTEILIGDPSTAPFGRYTKDALEAAGLWDRVKGKIRTRKNIELLAESLGSASPGTVGILFRTNLTDRLRTIQTIDRKLHEPIRYYMAPLKTSSQNPDVQGLLKFLDSPPARAIFKSERFELF